MKLAYLILLTLTLSQISPERPLKTGFPLNISSDLDQKEYAVVKTALKLGQLKEIHSGDNLFHFSWFAFEYQQGIIYLGFNCLDLRTDAVCKKISQEMLEDTNFRILFSGLARFWQNDTWAYNLPTDKDNEIYLPLQNIAKESKTHKVSDIETLLHLPKATDYTVETLAMPFIVLRYKSDCCLLDVYAVRAKNSRIKSHKDIPKSTEKLLFMKVFYLTTMK